MKVQVFVIFLFLLSFSIQLNALISIEIEPNDLEQVSEILQTFIQQQQQQLPTRFSTTRVISPLLKSITRSLIQMTGIMLTLVGANLLTLKLETFIVKQPAEKITEINNNTEIISNITALMEKCKNEYGCNRNRCWRTCTSNEELKIEKEDEDMKETWCYTSSKANTSDFQSCTFYNDCSPCWDCSSDCKLVH